MTEQEKALVERIRSDARVRFIAELPAGRAVIEIPVSLICTHPSLIALRGGDPWDVKGLAASIRESGEDSIYPISLLCEVNEVDQLAYFCGDGMQRLRALQSNQAEKTVAQVVVRWRDIKDAMGECLAANVHRLKWSEEDIFSVIRSKVLTAEQIKRYTQFSDSTYDRYATVASHEWLVRIVKEKCLGYAKAASLVKSCRESIPKLEALERGLVEMFENAEVSSRYYRDQSLRSKLSPKDRDKIKPSYWFGKAKQRLDTISDAVKSDDSSSLQQEASGNWFVPDSLGLSEKVGAVIGPDSEWKFDLALSNFFGRSADDVPLESFEEVLERWEDIRRKVEWHRDRIHDKEYRDSVPLPFHGKKVVVEKSSDFPLEQSPCSEIED